MVSGGHVEELARLNFVSSLSLDHHFVHGEIFSGRAQYIIL
jgi:hypothetical protein